jgi:hypothetical protein
MLIDILDIIYKAFMLTIIVVGFIGMFIVAIYWLKEDWNK